MCALSLMVDRNLLKDTHNWRQIHVSGLVFLFSCPKKSFNKPFEFLLPYQEDYIFPCVCTVIDHKRRLYDFILYFNNIQIISTLYRTFRDHPFVVKRAFNNLIKLYA